jgi:putative ABC transport system ATP-binding protein
MPFITSLKDSPNMPLPSPVIEAHKLTRHYRLGNSEVRALDGIDFKINDGEFVCIVGSSGSGKSTLLNLLTGLDQPTSGSIQTTSGDLQKMSSCELANYRAREVGLIFQSFNLIHHQTALDNVETALLFSSIPRKDRIGKSVAMLATLGLGDRLHHRPDDLSGGEQQRVAIARALVKNPRILFADEPTGNLDKENSRIIVEIIASWNKQGGTVIMVTHNVDLGRQYAHQVLRMEYGKFVPENSDDRGE